MPARPFRSSLAQFECIQAVLRMRDSYTEAHCGRVEALSLELGKACGLTARELAIMVDAARMHDVGKVGIPDRILLKPGKFLPQEWEVMKTHAALSESVCMTIPRRDMGQVARIVRHHHEAFDGSGYPDGLSGEDIPVSSRIIGLVDAYDAITTPRPYHQARNHRQTMALLVADSGRRFDAHVYRLFETVIADSAQRSD